MGEVSGPIYSCKCPMVVVEGISVIFLKYLFFIDLVANILFFKFDILSVKILFLALFIVYYTYFFVSNSLVMLQIRHLGNGFGV